MSDIEDRIVPDLEARMEEAVRVFRETHRHPVNLVLHAGAWLIAASGAVHVLRGEVLHGLGHLGLAAGMLVAGHRIEGNEPFDMVRRLRAQSGRW